ncbi:hypothetical protein NQ315_017033 [Exocentrus adspersus]|uniref:Uncharacterized protein n=1 Tax=Exocentrus adspersus TaxID=1586481 RepID=A0AAV8V6D3_9CUCU|nr:hypothetical protein NQ315_017033 [Exocentrus adspersus]
MKDVGGRRNVRTPRIIPVPKTGGILPILPILAGLSALGALAGGAAKVAKVVNDVQSGRKQLAEAQRHNNQMEAIALGVFMRDTLPTAGPLREECGIINLDSDDGAGTHWVAYKKHKKKVDYYDSFGDLPPPREFLQYLRADSDNLDIRYNYERQQDFDTVWCVSLIEMNSRNNSGDIATPQMDRESIRNMGQSLIAYSRLRTLTKMSRQQLANMPKEVIIACASNEIALVWEKLPDHLREDIDILKYQYCDEHYNYSSEDNVDVNDGPNLRKIFCCYCKVSDVNIATDNEVFKPSKRRKLTHDNSRCSSR